MPETTDEYIERHRSIYKSLRTVFSPALKENVEFNSEGFNHLITKRGTRRPLKIIKCRMPLIRLIIPTIKYCITISDTRIQEELYKGKRITATYYELKREVGNKRPALIKVVLKRRGKLGKLVFQSVMKQKTPGKGRHLS